MNNICTVAGCGQPHDAQGYCRTHYRRWQRRGDPRADLPIEDKTASGMSYWAVHRRLKAERGAASTHPCVQCGTPACDWSYDGGDSAVRTDPDRGYRYSLDPARYSPRCRSCHRRTTVARNPPAPRSRSVTDVERAARLYAGGASARGIAALLGTSRTAVYRALRAHGVPIRPHGTRTPPISTPSANQQQPPPEQKPDTADNAPDQHTEHL
jgi:hypothetical protein